MRTTDNRYAGELAQFNLAIRLIRHQARTHIITYCTGFSQDRIRKLYARYFKQEPEIKIRRHRGKSPSSVEFFVRNPWVQNEATVLAHQYAAWGLLRILPDLATQGTPPANRTLFGQRLCDAYEDFCCQYPHSRISFEHAWGLWTTLTETSALRLCDCAGCRGLYLQDVLALDSRRCPACRVAPRLQPGAAIALAGCEAG